MELQRHKDLKRSWLFPILFSSNLYHVEHANCRAWNAIKGVFECSIKQQQPDQCIVAATEEYYRMVVLTLWNISAFFLLSYTEMLE